jgi:hypothetical protein
MASSEEEDAASSAGSEASEASSHASDASDDVPEVVVSDAELALTTVKRQLATLASCRPDVLGAKQRTALIKTVEEAITAPDLNAARKLLAEWKGAYL